MQMHRCATVTETSAAATNNSLFTTLHLSHANCSYIIHYLHSWQYRPPLPPFSLMCLYVCMLGQNATAMIKHVVPDNAFILSAVKVSAATTIRGTKLNLDVVCVFLFSTLRPAPISNSNISRLYLYYAAFSYPYNLNVLCENVKHLT